LQRSRVQQDSAPQRLHPQRPLLTRRTYKVLPIPANSPGIRSTHMMESDMLPVRHVDLPGSGSLCPFCLHEVLESNKTWGYHHSYDALRISKDNCMVCNRLYEDVSSCFNPTPPSSQITHRWALRRMPRTREMDETVSLIFRAIIDETAREITPMMRQFFLIPDRGVFTHTKVVSNS
jgi:hypothetical protein